jgi:putative endonuclease
MVVKMYYTYIFASQRNGALYDGITSDLVKRVWQHKNEAMDGYTKDYAIKRLVYFEAYENVNDAIRREND